MQTTDDLFVPQLAQKKAKKSKVAKWDNYLYDYNNYILKYIKHYKKSTYGNYNSLIKYPYMKIRSEVLELKLYKAQIQNNLTPKQIDRFIEIKIKLVKSIC